MYTMGNKNNSGRSWIVIAMILAVFYLPAIMSAQLGFENRFKNENTIAAYDKVLNFAKVGENDVAKQLNEELLGTAKTRHKRLSDQRRAELETLMALSKMTEKLVNVIRGGRHLDLTKSGRRKRSIFDLNVKNLQKLFRLSGKIGYKGNKAYPVVS